MSKQTAEPEVMLDFEHFPRGGETALRPLASRRLNTIVEVPPHREDRPLPAGKQHPTCDEHEEGSG